MSATVNRQILLIEKPTGKLGPEHFRLSNASVPEPKDGEALLRTPLQELLAKLDPTHFQQIHRSTIVNLARVRSLRPHLNGECFLKLQSGQEVKLSRSFRDKVEILLDRSGVAPHAHRA